LNRFILRGELFDVIVISSSVDERRRFRLMLSRGGRGTSTEAFEDTAIWIGSGFVVGLGVGYD
jgi:hypothetical protein